MAGFAISDWDTAYDNFGAIAGSTAIRDSWQPQAAAYRAQARCALKQPAGEARYDLFMPDGTAKGLFVFIHGGYWQSTDASWWSHLAQGAVDAGWSAALPYYPLCPTATMAQILTHTTAAVERAAAQQPGPILLTGHSAGGHLAALLASDESPLSPSTAARLSHVVPISGLCDLRPLLHTRLNDALRLDEETAKTLSPVFKRPQDGLRLTAWVGGAERAEFLRQNRLLADMWHGLGALTEVVEEPDKHHFSVIDGLRDPNSPLMRKILGSA